MAGLVGGVCAGSGFGRTHCDWAAGADVGQDFGAAVCCVGTVGAFVGPGDHSGGLATRWYTDHSAERDEVVPHGVVPVLRPFGVAGRTVKRVIAEGVDDRILGPVVGCGTLGGVQTAWAPVGQDSVRWWWRR